MLGNAPHDPPVGATQRDSELFCLRGEIHKQKHTTTRTMICMNPAEPSFLYRHAWWVPATGTVLAVPLVVATLKPSEQSVFLLLAILCALPWTLALLLLDLSSGFADRAALVVCWGLCANVVLLWWSTALLRSRIVRGLDRRSNALEV